MALHPSPQLVDPSWALGKDRLSQRWSLTQPGNVNLGGGGWRGGHGPGHRVQRSIVHTWAHPEQSPLLAPQAWQVAGGGSLLGQPAGGPTGGPEWDGWCVPRGPSCRVCVRVHTCTRGGWCHKDLAPGRGLHLFGKGPPQQLVVLLAFTSGPVGACEFRPRWASQCPLCPIPPPTSVPVLTHTGVPRRTGQGVHWGEGGGVSP